LTVLPTAVLIVPLAAVLGGDDVVVTP